MQDGLDHLFPGSRVQVIELGGVIPGKAGAVIAVIDVAGVTCPLVTAPEDHGGVVLLVIMIVDLDLYPPVTRKVRSLKTIGGLRAIGTGHEPLRMLDDPAGIDAHVVGNHNAGEPDTLGEGPVAEVGVGRFTPQIVSDAVVIKGVCGGYGVLVAAKLLDGL